MSRLRNKYKVNEKTYNYNPGSLLRTYEKICDYSEEEFMNNLPEILHFCSFMSFVLDLTNEQTLADGGVIHELVHLLNENTRLYTKVRDVQEKIEELFGDIPVGFYIDGKYSACNG